MPIRLAGLLCGGVLLLSTPALAASPLRARIRAEGTAKTLISERTVTLADAPIVKDGDPSHSCAGQSALGALQAGSHGDWNGTWSDGLGYLVNEIRGFKPAGADFFTLWVNHRLSQTGACQTNLHAGDEVLLFVDRCVPDPATQGCKNKSVTPLGLRVTHRARRGSKFTVTVVSYNDAGKSKPLRGAKVYANQKPLKGKTNSHGRLRVRAVHIGHVSFYAKHAGNAKSEVEKTLIVKS
jgi:hypothetical protein